MLLTQCLIYISYIYCFNSILSTALRIILCFVFAFIYIDMKKMSGNKKMKKQQLIDELKSAQEQLKNYNKFLDLLKDEDDPKGILTRLNRTIGRIQMLVEANDIKELSHPKNEALQKPVFGKMGALVKVRPCGEEYGNKTYLGFLIGEIALGSSITTIDDKIQLNFSSYNPAMFVPELKKVIYGAESWWSKLNEK